MKTNWFRLNIQIFPMAVFEINNNKAERIKVAEF